MARPPDQVVVPTTKPAPIPELEAVELTQLKEGELPVETGADPALPAEPRDLDDAIAVRAAHTKLHKPKPKGFYWPARKLLEWGEVQVGRHATWSDLFWDLIFVGSAFKVGDFYKTYMYKLEGPLVLAGAGLTIINSWSHLLQYRIRFEAHSPAHKLLDVLEGAAAAATAHNVVADKDAFKSYHMYAFLTFALLNRSVQTVRRLELVLAKPPEGEFGSTRYAALDMLMRNVFEMSVMSIGFAFTEINSVMFLLIGVWGLHVLLFATPALLGLYQKRHMVPIHVEYTVRRMGEMIMLMLGEGMLSLTLSETKIDTTNVAECGSKCWSGKVKSGASFFSGYVLVAALMYLYYRSNKFTRHHHAVRRSTGRGILWNTSHWPMCIALIATGVSIKAIQPYAAKPNLQPAYVVSLGVATCLSKMGMALHQLLHPGILAFLRAPQKRGLRLALFGIKMVLSLASLAVLGFPRETEGWVYVFYQMLLACGSVVCLETMKGKAIERGLWVYADPIGDKMYHERGESAAPTRRNSTGMPRSGRVSRPGSLAPSRSSRTPARSPKAHSPTTHSPKARIRDIRSRPASADQEALVAVVADEEALEKGEMGSHVAQGDRRRSLDAAAFVVKETLAAESEAGSDTDESVDMDHHMYEMGVREDDLTQAEDMNATVVLTG